MHSRNALTPYSIKVIMAATIPLQPQIDYYPVKPIMKAICSLYY